MKERIRNNVYMTVSGLLLYLGSVWLSKSYHLPSDIAFGCFFAAYLLAGYSVFQKIAEHFLEKIFLDGNVLLVLTTIGAFGGGYYVEAVAVILIFQIGNLIEIITADRSKRRIRELIDVHAILANKLVDGEEVQVEPSELEKDDIIVIRPGERVPVDGLIISGTTSLDTQMITGETIPREEEPGGVVYGGSLNLTGVLKVRVLYTYSHSIASRILDIVEHVDEKKAESEHKVQKYIQIYVCLILVAAAMLVVLPSLFDKTYEYVTGMKSVVVFLAAACPCAIGMSVSTAFLGGILSAAKKGVIVKGGVYLELLAKVNTFLFDKTGTLTKATPTVKEIVAFSEYSENDLLCIAACLEEHFPHSMAKAVVRAAMDKGLVHEENHSKVEYIVAHGISSRIQDKKVIIGSYHFVFEDEQCVIPQGKEELFESLSGECSHLYLAIDGVLAAVIAITDPIREEAPQVVSMLRKCGLSKIVMMTGDSERTAKVVAAKVGVDEYYSEVLPEDKASYVEKEHQAGCKVIMIGDGVNDSPALSAADVGIAICDGAEMAREIADITIAGDNLEELVTLKRLSNALVKRIHGNYRQIVGFNTGLILCGIGGVMQPATSALLHNTSTLAISVKSMKDLLNEKDEK